MSIDLCSPSKRIRVTIAVDTKPCKSNKYLKEWFQLTNIISNDALKLLKEATIGETLIMLKKISIQQPLVSLIIPRDIYKLIYSFLINKVSQQLWSYDSNSINIYQVSSLVSHLYIDSINDSGNSEMYIIQSQNKHEEGELTFGPIEESGKLYFISARHRLQTVEYVQSSMKWNGSVRLYIKGSSVSKHIKHLINQYKIGIICYPPHGDKNDQLFHHTYDKYSGGIGKLIDTSPTSNVFWAGYTLKVCDIGGELCYIEPEFFQYFNKEAVTDCPSDTFQLNEISIKTEITNGYLPETKQINFEINQQQHHVYNHNDYIRIQKESHICIQFPLNTGFFQIVVIKKK